MCESIAEGGARCSSHSVTVSAKAQEAYSAAYGADAPAVDPITAAQPGKYQAAGDIAAELDRNGGDITLNSCDHQLPGRGIGVSVTRMGDDSVKATGSARANDVISELIERDSIPGDTDEERLTWLEDRADLIDTFYTSTYGFDHFDTDYEYGNNPRERWRNDRYLTVSAPVSQDATALEVGHELSSRADFASYAKATAPGARREHIDQLAAFIKDADSDVKSLSDSYVAAAIWTDEDLWRNSDESEGEEVDYSDITIHSLEPASRERLEREARAFYAHNYADIQASISEHGSDIGQIGHDLWLTRNGHGAGFWDRGWGDVGQRLSENASSLGGRDTVVENGVLHFE